eukprot:1395397-Prymnesium_polylepis.2
MPAGVSVTVGASREGTRAPRSRSRACTHDRPPHAPPRPGHLQSWLLRMLCADVRRGRTRSVHMQVYAAGIMWQGICGCPDWGLVEHCP